MTRHEFCLLNHEQKIDALLQGEIVNFRENEQRAIILQRLDGFYVEICFDKKTVDVIISLKQAERYMDFTMN
jgi:hypothetical protein